MARSTRIGGRKREDLTTQRGGRSRRPSDAGGRKRLTPVEQAGGIVVRQDGGHLSVLLVRAKKDPTLWIFPKGHIDAGETAGAAALRETREEAGIDGELVGPVGEPLDFLSGDELVRVHYFVIRPVGEVASSEGRETRWFAFGDARRALVFDGARRLLDTTRKKIADFSAAGSAAASARPKRRPSR